MIPSLVAGVGLEEFKPTSTPILLNVDANFGATLRPKWPDQADF